MVQFVRVPGWGFSIDDAGYYGWRWCIHFGPWLIFIQPLTLDQAQQWVERNK